MTQRRLPDKYFVLLDKGTRIAKQVWPDISWELAQQLAQKHLDERLLQPTLPLEPAKLN